MVALREVIGGRCMKIVWDKKAIEQIPEKRNDEPTDVGFAAGNPQTAGVSSMLCSPGVSALPSALFLTSRCDGEVGAHSLGCFPVNIIT